MGTVGQTESVEDILYDDALSLKLGFGYQLTPQVGVEISYLDLGTYKANDLFLDILSDDVFRATKFDIGYSGFDLSIVGNLPINEKAEVYGRLGLFLWDAEAEVELCQSGTFCASETGDVEDGSDINYGVGFLYSLNDKFSLRAEYGNYTLSFIESDEDVSNLSIGVNYLFQ